MGSLNGNTGNSFNHNEFIIAKYDPDRSHRWTIQNYALPGTISFGIALDASDNIYAAGMTEGDLDGNTSHGDFDIFMTKYGVGTSGKFTVGGSVIGYYATGLKLQINGEEILDVCRAIHCAAAAGRHSR